MSALSLYEHTRSQLEQLCVVVGTDPSQAVNLLSDLLGPAGSRPVRQPSAWPSNVADDETPIEFSVACNESERPTLRILGEALGWQPSAAANLAAAHRFLGVAAHRFNLSMSRFDLVQDLFVTGQPQGPFSLWHSMVFRNGRPPEFKVYFNPEVKGAHSAPLLVAEALNRLGLAGAYQATVDHGVRPGELGRADRLAFFALDLHDGPESRVKVYLTHHGADARDAVRAASAVHGIDAAEFAEFCVAAGGSTGPFDGRPLVSSYTFIEGTEGPAGYSLYVPIRSYVSNDEEARERVVALLDRYRHDTTDIDRAIAAVARRPLSDGVGLIAHVSLRLGLPRPGVTVYLSSEAYRVCPPRQVVAAAHSAASHH